MLGLRLVKRTVNFDAPDTYQLYYGDTLGRPSTLLTFFPWPGAPYGRDGVAAIGADSAIRGLFSVTMTERLLDPTAEMLAGLLGMRHGQDEAGGSRFVMSGAADGTAVDVRSSNSSRGLQAAGTVHHIAFRAPDGETQAKWRLELIEAGVQVTEIIDRQYFTSIYFREPGGVLLEIATDQPGFTIDELLLELGQHLKLPPWLEPNREQIQESLPLVRVPPAPQPGEGE